MAQQEQLESIKKWHQRWWGISFLVILAVFLLYIGAFIYQLVILVQAENQTNSQSLAFQQQITSGIDFRKIIEAETDPFWGPKDAKVVVVEFIDFQCPYCEEAYPIVKKLRQEYFDSVKFISRDIPNLAVHSQALDAALAARCANEQNKFWPYQDLMFENQANLSLDNLKLLASQLGLNSAQFNQCLDSQKYTSAVQSDMVASANLGVNGTPTFFLNGIKVAGVIPYESFKLIIEKIKSSLTANSNLNNSPVEDLNLQGTASQITPLQ